MAHVAPIFSLIYKEAHGIARTEVDPKLEMSFGGDCLQIFARIAKYQSRMFSFFVFARNEPGENAPKFEGDRACPRL